MENSMLKNMKIREIPVEGYERVVEFIEEESGLHAIISVHNTTLGPALGGTRVYPYSSVECALEDVLRLSRGMTYKAAAARTGTGGGKSVIIADSNKPKSEKLLAAYAAAVNSFGGLYICAEDVGMSLEDLGIVGRYTEHAVGLPDLGSSGDPSPYTMWGVFRGIQAACQHRFGASSVRGKTIAIQGLGAVGMKLARQLFWEGARIIVADVDERRVKHAEREFGAISMSPDEILFAKCDILAPCALGGILTPKSIAALQCKAVAGATNNQLLTDDCGYLLMERGILYAPDYVINSGGLLNVCVELRKEGYDPIIAREQVTHIYDLLIEIFTLAEQKKTPPHVITDEIVTTAITGGVKKEFAIHK
jgi:leucine dehydrogenase